MPVDHASAIISTTIVASDEQPKASRCSHSTVPADGHCQKQEIGLRRSRSNNLRVADCQASLLSRSNRSGYLSVSATLIVVACLVPVFISLAAMQPGSATIGHASGESVGDMVLMSHTPLPSSTVTIWPTSSARSGNITTHVGHLRDSGSQSTATLAGAGLVAEATAGGGGRGEGEGGGERRRRRRKKKKKSKKKTKKRRRAGGGSGDGGVGGGSGTGEVVREGVGGVGGGPGGWGEGGGVGVASAGRTGVNNMLHGGKGHLDSNGIMMSDARPSDGEGARSDDTESLLVHSAQLAADIRDEPAPVPVAVPKLTALTAAEGGDSTGKTFLHFKLNLAALAHPKRRVSYLREVERLMKRRPFNPLEPVLPPDHACANFTYSYPPLGPRARLREKFRACTVCLLTPEVAASQQPPLDQLANKESPLRRLSYVTESTSDQRERAEGDGDTDEAKGEEEETRFNGNQTWQQRNESFRVKEEMTVHCGFVWRGVNRRSQFALSRDDRMFMSSCDNIVVVTAIFGGLDSLHSLEPSNHSLSNSSAVCHVAFVDRLTLDRLRRQKGVKKAHDKTWRRGPWRVVLVSRLPYNGTRKAARIPKLLLHRLFPNAKYSMWLDGKLRLLGDPYSLLERFLWRGNFSFALPLHYLMHDVAEEGENVKMRGKSTRASVDAQVDAYRADGMRPFSLQRKFPIISDVPDSALLLRAHTPLSNLLSCLWYNEVHRFTPRDQLSFAYARDKIISAVPGWRVNMFLDCEKRNVTEYWPHNHRKVQT